MDRRRLIINADDFGLDQSVNAAIEELCDAGRLGGVSMLATGAHFEEAARAIRAYPRVGIGIHLNAVEGRPLSPARDAAPLLDRTGAFPGLGPLLARCLLRPGPTLEALEIEWRAQIERARTAGLQLSHADSHQHAHAFPTLFALAARLCREYEIPCIRVPRERFHPGRRPLGALALRSCLRLSRPKTVASGLGYNDFFLGFGRAGGYTLDALRTDLRELPLGLTELSVHPSTQNHAPYAHFRSDDERKALLAPAFLQCLREFEIETVSWRAPHA